MANTVGTLIKEARTKARLTQEQLAAQVEGLTASDISKAERGEKQLSQAALKQIAKVTGVTQASLLNAAKEDSAPKSEKKTSTKKTSSKKTNSSEKDELTLTSTEKKLVTLYRAADSDTKKQVMGILKGETAETEETGNILSSILGSAMDMLSKK